LNGNCGDWKAETRNWKCEIREPAGLRDERRCGLNGWDGGETGHPGNDLDAATRGTERGRAHEFRRFWCRMISCAELGAAQGNTAWVPE